MTEVEQPPQNGIDLSANEEDESSKARPADIEQDMREMERRKRVEAIMGSKLFREELERIVDSARDGGNTAGILQQLSDIVGGPSTRVGSIFKSTNCMLPINDIRGVESMGYAKGEKILRCKLAAAFRLLDLYGWTQGLGAQITARLKVDQEYFLVNPYGLLYHEITASALNKVDMQGHIVEQGTTNFGVNKSHFVLHSAVHAARPDIRCAIYIGCSPVVAISSLKNGLLPLTKDACVLGDVTTFSYSGCFLDEEERNKLVRNLGPNSKVMLLTNHGALCCGETIEEAFFAACHIVQACETQLKLLPVGLDNLVLIPEESRKAIYEQARRPPDDLEKKFAVATAVTAADSNKAEEEAKKEDAGGETKTKVLGQPPKWRVGGAEFEALMRMLDNAGYRTGYIYRHPLIKSDPPKPKNDVELPPAVSSLGYLLEEEELFRQGIWKKGAFTKGGDRSRWLNSPNVYQKVEVLETGTPDPKKITKWVAEGSPTHSTPVRIDDPLQFVPVNTNPKEFKRLQQQIKDNRRADKISAGPQSHILEGVTWDEANRIKDATVSQAGDHVVLMGAASKGIIQRGFQHNASVYKTPYAKNPFDNVTDDELNEYKRTVERKKKSIHGEYTDTDFSESEALSSLQTSGAQQPTKQNTTTTTTTAAVSQSEPEDISEHHIMRIETQQAPVPSQPEVVLSDATLSFINGERSHTAVNRKPPTGRDNIFTNNRKPQDSRAQDSIDYCKDQREKIVQNPMVIDSGFTNDKAYSQGPNEDKFLNSSPSKCSTAGCKKTRRQSDLIKEMECDPFYQKRKHEDHQHKITPRPKMYTNNTQIQMLISENSPTTSKCGNDNILDRSLFTPLSLPNSLIAKDLGNGLVLDSSKAQLESSLCFNTSSSPNQDTLSYYTTSYFNNSQRAENDLPAVYDSLNEINITTKTYPTEVQVYKISLHCYTPQICGEIFRVLQEPHSPLQQNYLGANSLQDLIWNAPFQSNYSPFSITPENCITPPRRAECKSPLNSCHKSRSPYRTLSHFGFNSPQRDPQPDHKHVPPTDGKKYKPLRRSVSYEEIFSSPRYIDLCEQCFEQLVRLKPEILLYRTKLRNLAEYCGPPTTPTTLNVESETRIGNKIPRNGCHDENLEQTDTTLLSNKGDTIDSNEATEPLSVFSSHLETLTEVEEADSSDDRVPVDSMITNSSFIDKITRMNYSHELTNFINTPITIQSHISSNDPVETDDGDPDILTTPSQEEEVYDEELSTELRNLMISDEREMDTYGEENTHGNDSIENAHCACITAILEFNNWIGDIQETPKELENKQQDDEICMDFENPIKVIPSKTQAPVNDLVDTVESSGSLYSETQTNFQRSLMSRDERTRRKLEFQELWEDHITYYENREKVLPESSALSDTESAMGDATQFQSLQNSSPCDMPAGENFVEYLSNGTEETFPSRSFIYPTQNTDKNTSSNGSQEDEEAKSSSSQHTFNISEPCSSQENILYPSYIANNILDEQKVEDRGRGRGKKSKGLKGTQDTFDNSAHTSFVSDSQENCLFRSFGSTNIVADFATGGNHKQITQGIRTFFDENELIGSDNVKDSDDLPSTQLSLGYKPTTECFQIQKQLVTEEDTSCSSQSIRDAMKHLFEKQKLQQVTKVGVELNTKTPPSISKNSTENDQRLIETETDQLSVSSQLKCGTSNGSGEQIHHQNSSIKDTLRSFASNQNKRHISKSSNLEDALPSDDQNKENKNTDNEFSTVERKILRKIDLYQLNKAEEIFNKIEHSIRNKLTPSKMEMRVREQLLLLYSDELIPGSKKTAPLEENSDINPIRRSRSLTPLREKPYTSPPAHLNNDLMTALESPHSRRSRSLTPLHKNSPLPLLTLNKTLTPPNEARHKQFVTPRNQGSRTPSPSSSNKSSNNSNLRRRNFIMENIRNASIPRNTNHNVKRLRCNAEAIFCKNPFGPRLSASDKALNPIKKPLKSLTPNRLETPHSSPNCSSNCSNNVYTFQSKLVRGSPKFWVTMTQSPRKKTQTCTPSKKVACKKRTEKPLTLRHKDNKSFTSESFVDVSSKMSCISVGPGLTDQSIYNRTVACVTSDILKAHPPSHVKLWDHSSSSSSSSLDVAVTRVDAEITALGQEIQQIQPRLESYKRKLDDFGDRVTKCARHMDECVATQEEIISEQEDLGERIMLQQYADEVICRVQTYSLSETED